MLVKVLSTIVDVTVNFFDLNFTGTLEMNVGMPLCTLGSLKKIGKNKYTAACLVGFLSVLNVKHCLTIIIKILWLYSEIHKIKYLLIKKLLGVLKI